jgi:hypothetical protein
MFLFQKEYKSISRQARSWWLLLMAFIIPFAIFYFLFSFSSRLIQEQIEGSNKKRFKVAWVAGENQAEAIRKKLDLHLQIDLLTVYTEDDLADALENDSISVGIVIGENFDSALSKLEKAEIMLYYKGSSRALSIVEKTIGNYRREISKKNVKESNLPEGIVNPIEVTEKDLSNMQEMIDNVSELLNKSIATLLSLLLLIFGSIGARFGLKTVLWKEKAQGLLSIKHQSVISPNLFFRNKTLITSLFAWKMMFLALLGFAAALSMKQVGIMHGIMLQLRGILDWNNLGILIFTAIPLSFFFSAFWAFIGFWTSKGLSAFLGNLIFAVLLLIFTLAGSSSTLLNEFNAFAPFLNLIYLNQSIFSGEQTLILTLIAWLGMLCWGLLLTVINAIKFRKI